MSILYPCYRSFKFVMKANHLMLILINYIVLLLMH